MIWTDEDIKIVEKFIDIKNRGYYCDGGQLTVVYNRVLEKNVPTTNCGSCMRARIGELETALKAFKKAIEKEQKNEDENKPTEENILKKKVGRPKKN